MQPTGYSTVTTLRRYCKMAQSCGVDCDAALRAAGIDPAVIAGDNSGRVSDSGLERFLARVIDASGEPCFGLKSARLVQPDSFDILGYIALNCANLGEALALFPLYESVSGDLGKTTVEVHGERVLIRWDCSVAAPLVRRHMLENVLASWTVYSNRIIGVESKPALVWFAHSAPAGTAVLAEYRDIFHCQVLFEQPCSGIWVQRCQLQIPFPQANRALLATLLEHAAQSLAALDRNRPIEQRVRNRIRLMLAESLPSRERVAEQLGMSGRTLQRQLSSRGCSYHDLLREVRRQLAQHYLQNSALSLDEISRRLGFSETRSFHRSFKQWTGVTASAFRAQAP